VEVKYIIFLQTENVKEPEQINAKYYSEKSNKSKYIEIESYDEILISGLDKIDSN
jgi:hypothetical protein